MNLENISISLYITEFITKFKSLELKRREEYVDYLYEEYTALDKDTSIIIDDIILVLLKETNLHKIESDLYHIYEKYKMSENVFEIVIKNCLELYNDL
jgi:hypothetical protein